MWSLGGFLKFWIQISESYKICVIRVYFPGKKKKSFLVLVFHVCYVSVLFVHIKYSHLLFVKNNFFCFLNSLFFFFFFLECFPRQKKKKKKRKGKGKGNAFRFNWMIATCKHQMGKGKREEEP